MRYPKCVPNENLRQNLKFLTVMGLYLDLIGVVMLGVREVLKGAASRLKHSTRGKRYTMPWTLDPLRVC